MSKKEEEKRRSDLVRKNLLEVHPEIAENLGPHRVNSRHSRLVIIGDNDYMTINLHKLELEEVRGGILRALSYEKIIRVKLNYNQIRNIEDEFFHEIRHVYRLEINENSMEKFSYQGIKNLLNMESLALSYNKLGEVDIDFSYLIENGSLNFVDLRFNTNYNRVYRKEDILNI